MPVPSERKQIPRAAGPRNDSGRVRRKLLSWYRREKRQLPWRGTRDPYRIWVSEVMLQQTTVAAVRNRFDPFLRRFPDVHRLARSREDSVLAAWSGLGYYGRARNLRRAARVILREHGGRFPRDADTLATLPGFGPYTAAAVASLAFGAQVPAAEANVTRVVSRLFAVEGRLETRAHREVILGRVRPLLPPRNPGDALAALMDLGQTICLPRDPQCPRCPLRRECAGQRLGKPSRYPARAPKPRPVNVHLAAVFAQRGDSVLLVRRRGSFLDGLWEFPSTEGPTAAGAREKLSRVIRPLGLRLSSSPRPLGAARHAVVNRRLQISVFPAVLSSPSISRLPPPASAHWFRAGDLSRAAVPTLTKKIARAAGFLHSPNA